MGSSMFTASEFVFRKNKVEIPGDLTAVTPPKVRDALHTARQAAATAFHVLKRLDVHYARRFHRLCPTDDYTRLENHALSVERLFSWRKEYFPDDPTFTTSAKMPRCVFAFHVNEDAYKSYVNEHEVMKLQYLNGPYYHWQKKAQDFEDLLCTSGIGEVDKRYCLEWWSEFREEMKVWEKKFDELELPSWEKMIDKLSETIEIVVDLDNEWETV